jgi:hypothetical protein
MTNDQIQMTNEGGTLLFGHWCLVIGHSYTSIFFQPPWKNRPIAIAQRT